MHWWIVLFLFFSSVGYGQNYSIAFVHIGDTIPSHLFYSVKQARFMNPSCDLYLLVNYKICNLIHLENDTMLYVDGEELLPHFEAHRIAIGAPFESLVACIPSFVFIRDEEAITSLIRFINRQLITYRGTYANMEVGDMHSLAAFSEQFGEEKLLPLPVLMPEYAERHEKRTSSYSPDNSTPLSLLFKNADLFPGYLFDAATLGVYANGNYTE